MMAIVCMCRLAAFDLAPSCRTNQRFLVPSILLNCKSDYANGTDTFDPGVDGIDT
jgi:hypothetical protein